MYEVKYGAVKTNHNSTYDLYFKPLGFVQIGVWGGTPQKTLSPDEPPKSLSRHSGRRGGAASINS
jgi:hypothetical protein